MAWPVASLVWFLDWFFGMAALINVERLQAATGLATVECHDRLSSTMDRGRELAASTSGLPALIMATRQHAGRGRRGAAWWQPPGSLAMTLVLDARKTIEHAGGPLPLWAPACGLAVAEAIETVCPTVRPQVRWPNDVEVGGRKLAGVLVEATTSHHVLIGVGINTTGSAAAAPVRLRERLTTLPDAGGRSILPEELLEAVVPRLVATITAAGTVAGRVEIVHRYQAFCSLTNHPVTLFDVLAEQLGRPAGTPAHLRAARLSGRCGGVDESGRLLVDSAAGRLAIIAGSLTDPAAIWTGEDAATRG